VCLHAGNTRAEVDRLVETIMEWANGILAQRREEAKDRRRKEATTAVRVLLESKL